MPIEFGSYSVEVAEEEARQSSGSAFIKLQNGVNRLRILPPEKGEKSPFKTVLQHVIEKPGDTRPIRFGCPGQGCPACEMASRLHASGNPKDEKQARSFERKLRTFAIVINRKEEERGPLIWEFGKTVAVKLQKIRVDEDAGGEFTHPYKGFDVKVEKTGEGLGTRYEVMAARESSPLAPDEETLQSWWNSKPDLNNFTRISSLDDVLKLLGSPDDEDEAPVRGRLPAGRVVGTKRRTAEDDLES